MLSFFKGTGKGVKTVPMHSLISPYVTTEVLTKDHWGSFQSIIDYSGSMAGN